MMTKQAVGGSIGYQGHVTVKVMNGHRIITEYSQHNEGLPYLMNGLCNLFAGVGRAESIRPGYIAAYSLAEDEGTSAPATDTPWLDLVTEKDNKAAQLTVASSYCILDLAAEQTASSSTGATITYTAKIPYSLITAGKIHMLALLPSDINAGEPNIEQKALACYRLANSSRWLPVYCSRAEADSMLLVEWQMNFSDYGGAN